ncbi:MAG TPA: SIMPL domain-containing protein [Thermomicrobiales bacterium]|nr:SIMPL domain-containing protein [Thermomicrobiales bacterium]
MSSPNPTPTRRWLERIGAGMAIAGLLAAGALGIGGVAAQEIATPGATAPANQAFGQPTVTVTGHGSVTVPPDTAGITIGVDIIRSTLAEAQSEANAQATAVIDAVKAQGIDEKDIQTSNFSVSIMRDYSEGGDPTKITGFEVMNQVNVTIRDISKIGDVLDAVVTAGANSIYNIFFFVDDPAPHESAARKLAVQDAHDKADELATAAGMTLGPVLSITEGTMQAPPQPVFAAKGGGMGAAAQAAPIQAGTSEITADVTITYAMSR